MNPKDKDLMERYIYQVVRRLPKEQRHEVSLELQELISDMLENGDSMEAVLTELGSPAEFAKRYQDSSHCLIGPEYYDNYIWFLKIVLTCAAIAVIVVSIIEGISGGYGLTDENIVQAVIISAIHGLVNGFANLVIACISVFGGVTLMFALMERNKVAFDMRKEKKWSVKDLGDNFTSGKLWTPNYLSPVPHKKAIINRSDSVVSIVFFVIFSVLVIFAPNVFSAIFRDGEVVSTIPVFNLERWNLICPLFVISLVIGLVDEVFRLIVGRYCKPVMVSNIVCGFIQIVLSVIVFKVLPFWNPDFASEIKVQLGEQLSSGAAAFIDKWNGDLVSTILLTGIILLTLLEIGTTVYKTFRYGTEMRR